MYTKDYRDIIGGGLITAFGLFVTVYSQKYSIGELARMGPGYFPMVLGIILTLLGLLIIVTALFRQGTRITIQWKSAFLIILSLIVFALTLERFGLFIAAISSTLISTIATNMNMRARVTVSVAITALTFLIFYVGLRMSIPLWPT